MSGHSYNYLCGCASCSQQEEAFELAEELEQRREDAIEARAQALFAERRHNEDLAAEGIGFVTNEGLARILDAAGRFVARYGAADDANRAEHAAALYRALQPHVDAYIREVAESDAKDEYDRPRGALLDQAARRAA